nr:hypothetical protein CFP56_08740 [Quercus suber]
MSYSGLMYSEMAPRASGMTSTEVNLKNMDNLSVCWRQPHENCTGIHDAFIAIGFISFCMGEGSRKILPQYGIFLVLRPSKQPLEDP